MSGVFRFLSMPPSPPGTTSLAHAARDWRARLRCRGPVFLISDFLDPAGAGDALDLLGAAGFETVALQVLAPRECEPELRGEWILEDAETGERREARLDDDAAAAVARSATLFSENLEGLCRRRGTGFFSARTDCGFEEVVLRGMRRAGILH